MPPTRSKEENYNCIMKIMNVAVCEGLGEMFKQEWDKQYGTIKGVWDDTPKSGNELYNMERTRSHANPYLNLYQAGKRSEWDCSALFDAILYSNAIKRHLNPHLSNKVDELRELRNKLTHKMGRRHEISDIEFDKNYKKVQNCLKALKLSTASVEKIAHSFKGRLVTSLEKMACISFIVFLVGGLLSCAFHYWFANPMAKSPFRFRDLPARPVHLVANRSRTVNSILEELHNLSIKNNGLLSYLYISGNPGSGKSQLARLVGQRYGTNSGSSISSSDGAAFVMTLKGTSLPDMLKSYVDFARRVNCIDNNIANIINSKETTTVIKINSIRTEIAKRLKDFKNSWLLIVDNVVKMSEIIPFLPQLQDEDWQGGQVLITTQDMSSVPSNSSITVHISVSQGMDPIESCEFLADLSGLVENFLREVAAELDHQPLALASAAFYVKLLRESKASAQFTWKDYLKKFNEGKRNLTEMKLTEVNHAYSMTMSTAVLLSVKMFAENNPILRHAFTLFSFLSHEPLPLDIIANYVIRIGKYDDKEDVRLRILQCSLFLPLEYRKPVSISLHRVVHDSIKLYTSNEIELIEVNTKLRVPLYVLQLLLEHKNMLLNDTALIPHLKAFHAKTKNLSSDVFVPDSMKIKQEMQEDVVNLTTTLMEYGESILSKYYLTIALRLARNECGKNGKNDQDTCYNSFPKIHQIFLILGNVEANLRSTIKAKKYYERSLEICLKLYGEFHEDVATLYMNLAYLACLRPNECHEGAKYAKLALKLDNRPFVQGLYYMYLGMAEESKGRLQLKKAEIYYLKALETFMDKSDRNYSVVVATNCAFIFTKIGMIQSRTGRYEKCKASLKLAFKFYQAGKGFNHLGLADLYYTFGVVHYHLNELADAEKNFRLALEIYSKQLESDHEKIAMASAYLAGVLRDTGRLSEATYLSEKYGIRPRPHL